MINYYVNNIVMVICSCLNVSCCISNSNAIATNIDQNDQERDQT